MFNIDFTFIWTAVNLAVIYWVVRKFLFKRLGTHMDKRAAGIAADIENGQTLKAEGESYKQKYETLLQESAAQQQALMAEARKAAEAEYARIVSEAKQEAVRLKVEAREQIEHERAQMKRELSRDIVSLAIDAASRVLESNMDDEKNRTLVEHFLSEEGAA